MMLANTGHNGEPMKTPSICLQNLLLKLNTVLVQISKISFFIVQFHKVVGTLSTHIRFRKILPVLFNGTLVNNEVTSKLMNLYPSLNSLGGMAFISLAASKESSME